MKKLFVLIIAIMMVGGLTACGGGSTQPTPEDLIQALKESDASLGERTHGMMIGDVLEVERDDINYYITSIVDLTEPTFECGTIAMADGDATIMINTGNVAGLFDPQRFALVLLKELGVSEENLARVEEEVLTFVKFGQLRVLVVDGYLVSSTEYIDYEEKDTRRQVKSLIVIKLGETMTDYVEGELRVSDLS